MTHSANGPTVSLEEARRIDRESAQHLLNSRRLSLIVDLDQTIVHATVDPTVGEWIAEGEAWEARRAKRIAAAKRSPADGDPGHDPDPDPDPDPGPNGDGDGNGDDDDDVVNPNWEALKDVKKFRLGPESFAALPGRNPRFLPKEKAIENQGCLYYVKPRYVPSRPPSRPAFNNGPPADPVGRSSSPAQRPSMKCTFIQWVRALTLRKCVPLSIPTASTLSVVSSAATRAAVRPRSLPLFSRVAR